MLLDKNHPIEKSWYIKIKNPGTIQEQLNYLSLEVVDNHQDVKWYKIK